MAQTSPSSTWKWRPSLKWDVCPMIFREFALCATTAWPTRKCGRRLLAPELPIAALRTTRGASFGLLSSSRRRPRILPGCLGTEARPMRSQDALAGVLIFFSILVPCPKFRGLRTRACYTQPSCRLRPNLRPTPRGLLKRIRGMRGETSPERSRPLSSLEAANHREEDPGRKRDGSSLG